MCVCVCFDVRDSCEAQIIWGLTKRLNGFTCRRMGVKEG